ncbi:response regulator [Aestuariispira insulae]|uniref:Response regulator receiver domain-containing protein n=1 Tax=Aestuariispira insulae TaxID=1461337 RepID=A0A3D9HRI4_9PROT|nr:response regulator [Aestuariispira insulae]RED52124.1 response regulator receiver domain-containing protein [Aestuariispira insulae]
MRVDELLDINLAIFDLGAHTIGLTKKALSDTGFRHITLFQDPDGLLDQCRLEKVDLIIIDDTHETQQALSVIRRLRDPAEGMVTNSKIVALLAERSEKSVGNAIACGVDNILVKPLQADKVRASLLQVMRDDRPYMTFDGYIGPDRRRRASQLDYTGSDRRLGV